jgi:hypothetical protein
VAEAPDRERPTQLALTGMTFGAAALIAQPAVFA